MINIELFETDVPEKWFSLSGPLKGVELLMRYASPEYSERFGKLLLNKQIHRNTREGREIVPGREEDYVLEFCRHYVVDWRGVIHESNGQPAPYRPEALAKVLLKIRSALEATTSFISQEEAFFTKNGSDPS